MSTTNQHEFCDEHRNISEDTDKIKIDVAQVKRDVAEVKNDMREVKVAIIGDTMGDRQGLRVRLEIIERWKEECDREHIIDNVKSMRNAMKVVRNIAITLLSAAVVGCASFLWAILTHTITIQAAVK